MKGLNSNFQLDNGKFVLSSGVARAKDALWMYSIFDRFRMYSSDYGANFLSLLQLPTSQIIRNKTIYKGVWRKGIAKYVPNVILDDVDMGYFLPDRTNLHIQLIYKVIGDKTNNTEVIFI